MADYRYMRTDQDIQRAFFKLLQEDGFEKINVSNLAKESLVDRSTFYAHYESIYDIAQKVISDKVNIIRDSLNKSRGFDAKTRYNIFSSELVNKLLQNVEIIEEIRLIPMGTQGFDSQCRQLFAEYYLQTSGLAKNSFTSFLFVNMGMSDLDFVITNRRAPKRDELKEGFIRINQVMKQLSDDE